MSFSNSFMISKYFDRQLRTLSYALLSKKSIIIKSNTINPLFLIHSLLNDQHLDEMYMGRNSHQFRFMLLDTDTLHALQYPNSTFVEVISKALSREHFKSYEDIVHYLNSENKYLVLYSHAESESNIKNLFEYKMYFGSRLLFVFSTDNVVINSDYFETVLLENGVIRNIIEERLVELDVILDTQEVETLTDDVKSDIFQIDESIIKFLYKKTQNTHATEMQVATATIAEETKKRISLDQINQSFETIQPSPKPFPKVDRVSTQKPSQPLGTALKSVTPGLHLTVREEAVYGVLQKNKFISREELADLVWGPGASASVSPDAIDQFVSRMRKKFVNAGFEKGYITSKKGEGVVLND